MGSFTRDDLESYEKRPQTKVDDKVSPFRGATPAKPADPAALAAVQAGLVDATPGGTPAAAAAAPDPLVDDAPVVDEDGTLGNQSETGEGTSAVESEEAAASAVDLGNEADPNTDLTGEQPVQEEPTAATAPKKGSAQERIVEILDLAEGYKVFGQHMQDQLKEALAENARLRAGGGTAPPASAPAVAPPVVEKDEPMPDMSDEDVGFDNDKYRVKMAKWVKTQGRIEARRALREEQGVSTAVRVRETVEAKCETFAKDHPDFKEVVTNNPVLIQNQLASEAGLIVAQSEHTAELLYRFGKDPGLAIRTARQSPIQQGITIDRMIREIEAEKAKGKPVTTPSKVTPQAGAKPVATKSQTKAPPPPRPTPAAGRPAARDVLDPNMDMNEFARLHRTGKQTARAENRKQRGLD